MKKFYLTTPIYYPNARPHVGSAYTTIVCDVLARYKRMCGYNVAFLTGTDEHGEKLQRAADAAGIPVEQFVAEKRELFKNLWQTLGISEYKFVHTSQNPDHRASVQWMVRQADKAGYIEKRKYEGRYCVFDERYVSDSPEPANCDICGRPAELIREENYFFKLSAFQDRLLDLYDKQPTFVQPDFRMNEVKSFVKSGLRDISISRRRLKWGIPWPDDPEQVVYVWYDALTSYLTGIGFAGDRRSEEFDKCWPADVHMIGKDILRFHAVYWPAFLWAAGLELPKTIFAHGWIYYEQDKMSKSKGNVVYPEPIVDALNSFGAPGNDALRYYLLRDTPFGQDASFSYEALIQRYNSDLANDLGNLVSRTINMLHKYCGGSIPRPPDVSGNRTQALRTIVETDLLDENFGYCFLFDHYRFSHALDALWKIIGDTNKYLVLEQPWKIVSGAILLDEEGNSVDTQSPSAESKLKEVLYTTAEVLRIASVLIFAVLPQAGKSVWKQLGCEERDGTIEDQRINQLRWGQLKPGTKVGKTEPIFPRLDKEKTLARLHELAEADRERESGSRVETPRRGVSTIEKPAKKGTPVEQQPEQKPAAVAPMSSPAAGGAGDSAATNQKITIDDFAKVDLRVGTILSAEPIPGATKLLKLQVDIGSEVRQVCAGIAEHYQPEQLIGMKVVIVANLQPRKLRGIESNGMVVAASVGEQGKPVLVTFKEEVPNGARLK